MSRLLCLLAILAAIALLWETPVVRPLRTLVVFFHELSHGLVAVATGGKIEEIRVDADGSGLCITRGGSRFLVLSAGYLGSLALGGLILVLAARSVRDRVIVGLAGVLLIAVSVLSIRPFSGYGFISCTAAGAVLLACARWLPVEANDVILKVIGLSSCLYVLLDLKAIAAGRMGSGSDAHALGRVTGLPYWLWGVIWLCLAIAAAVWFLMLATRGPRDGSGQRGMSVRKGTAGRPALL
jgi:hypothetical protein